MDLISQNKLTTQWSLWSGYGAAYACVGFPVLEVVSVFHAEFPGVSHFCSLPVALFTLTQWLVSGFGIGVSFHPPL